MLYFLQLIKVWKIQLIWYKFADCQSFEIREPQIKLLSYLLLTLWVVIFSSIDKNMKNSAYFWCRKISLNPKIQNFLTTLFVPNFGGHKISFFFIFLRLQSSSFVKCFQRSRKDGHIGQQASLGSISWTWMAKNAPWISNELCSKRSWKWSCMF